MSINPRCALIILDGWGIGPDPEKSAIYQASTPFVDSLYKKYANATLITHGEDVGLPAGQMGNSEVGHLNIGAGRVVYQELARINKSIRDGEFFELPALVQAIEAANTRGGNIHLLGLLSDGGVHSHIDHLKAHCDLLKQKATANSYIHAFTDGRDVDPKSGVGFVKEIETHLEGSNTRIASITGRYYAMDRDKRWERTKLAYDALVRGTGAKSDNLVDSILHSYETGVTDEFITPIIQVDENQQAVGNIKDGDTIIFFNFRTDRPRQLMTVLSQNQMPKYGMHTLDCDMITMTAYDESYKNVTVLFQKDNLVQTLGEYLSELGKTQVRLAETEKYPHVTFFFSGGREEPFESEDRIMIPSPDVATYDLKPSMSAVELTDALVQHIEEKTPDFICLNYANTDMVGHTGVFSAAVEAAETVDSCLSRLIPTLLGHEYGIIVIADHGNSDMMINEDGSPNTAHSMNPVPVLFVTEAAGSYHLADGVLADVAPTLLHIIGLEPPVEMTGKNLLGN